MPTFRVTGPDGATYEVTPPEGTNPSESEILAQVQAQASQQAPAQTGGIADTINAGLKSARDWFQPAANAAVRSLTTLPEMLGGPPDTSIADRLTGGRGVAAEVVNPVPGDMTSAGAQVGTLAAGPLGPLMRILGAGAGAGAGSLASGKDMGAATRDAGLYGATAGGVEGGSALLSKLIRSLPNNPLLGGKRNISEGDAAGYGARMGEQSPPLAGATGAQDLRGLAAGEGQGRLGEIKEQVVQAIEQRISAGPVLPMPSLGGQGMSLREANDELSRIGALAFSKNPLDRTANGIDQRRLYGQVARDIEQGLGAVDPQSARLFSEVQGVYSRGMSFLKPLQRQDAFRTDSSGLQFNTPALQRMVGSPKGEAQLRNKLGDQGFEELRDTLLRGGQPGEVDRLASGSGNVLDAILRMGRQGGGFGTTAALPFQTALPNVGSTYAGQAPYTAPNGLQILLDLIGERAMEQARQGAPVPIGPTYGR